MERWTFLLQKDGDRSWLPLDSPDVEILKGRYRIVAQTNHPNTDISIRICHLSTEADPPTRRIQKRSHRTNINGLMVVTPYTFLETGLWELSCFLSDPMSDLVGDTLHHAVKLRVCDRVLQDEDDSPVSVAELEPQLEAVWVGQSAQPQTVQPKLIEQAAATVQSAQVTTENLAALNVEIARALGLSMERLVEMTDQLSHQLVDDIFREFNFVPAIADASITASNTEASAALPIADPEAGPEIAEIQPAIDPTKLQIVLQRDDWMARRGESLTIAGQCEAAIDAVDSDPVEPELTGAIAQEIQIRLRDPQSSNLVFHACQSFPSDPAPLSFSFLCSLPNDLSTHLLLGEVLICGTLPGAESVIMTLKTHTFTVTIDPEILVEELQKVKTVLAESDELAEMPELLAQLSSRLKQKVSSNLDLSFLNMTALPAEQRVEVATVATKPFSTATKQILPPQLHQSESTLTERSLQLPVFIEKQASPEIEQPIAAQESVEAAIEAALQMDDLNLDAAILPELSLEEPSQPELDTVIPEVTEPSEGGASSKQSTPNSDSEGLDAFERLSSPIRTAFQALNLQDRFLNRLSSLAADAELTTLLKVMHPPELTTNQKAATATMERSPIVAEVAESSTVEEVVVEDDPSWREWIKRAGSRSKRSEPAPEPPPTHPLVLPADVAVPTPILEVTTDPLVAGKPINVRVKLPDLLPKIYVKLWVNDRQTRSLLDGPRWLVDFLPDGHGELEALTQLTAPFGSLDIRLEAIAVEMHTQRESQKVSLEREVLSPDLPDELFDFDL